MVKHATFFGIGSCRENALCFAAQGMVWSSLTEAEHYLSKIPANQTFTLQVFPLAVQLA